MKKYRLLDHKWQKVGFVMFAFCVLLALLFWQGIIYDIFPYTITGQPKNAPVGHGWATILFFLFVPVSLVLMALSQEKQEDERIVETRHQILARIVIFYIVLILIRTFVYAFLARILPTSSIFHFVYSRIISYCTGVTAFIGYYVLFFKLSLWKQNRDLSDEE